MVSSEQAADDRLAPTRSPAEDGGGSTTRRELIGAGLGLGGAAALAVACAGPNGERPAEGEGATAESFELDELTFGQLQSGMQEGRWTSERLTELYLTRIDELDGRGPQLRSVIETNPEALEIARRLDDERRAGRVLGPLHGIPVLVKDNIATADRMTTTAGSLALEGSIPSADSGVARRLREAGAVLLGKANLSEWANFRSRASSSGWSGRGGQCRNPYALDRNPCGSSSGSGAATSANLCAAAIGTETNGSVVCPSSANGIVGIKPTVGLVSRARIIPISHTQDTAGPMARTVRDAALLLGALAGTDPDDPVTGRADHPGRRDYSAQLDAGGLRGARIGVGRYALGFDARVDRLFDEAMEALRAGGAELIAPVETSTAAEIRRPSFELMLFEMKADLNAYLAALGPSAPVRSLEDVIRFNEEHREREMPYFGQDLLEAAQEKGPLTEPEYLAAVAEAQRLSREQGIDATMDEHTLDAIVAPTGGPAWLTDLVNGDHFSGGSSSPAAIAGYPNVTVPMGYVKGLPVGLSFFGRAWSEPGLLRLAFAFEQATRHRRAPGLLPSLDLERGPIVAG